MDKDLPNYYYPPPTIPPRQDDEDLDVTQGNVLNTHLPTQEGLFDCYKQHTLSPPKLPFLKNRDQSLYAQPVLYGTGKSNGGKKSKRTRKYKKRKLSRRTRKTRKSRRTRK